MRAIAAAKLTAEGLKFWWCKKYNRPLKDPLLQTYTLEELQIEYFMYAIEEDPQEAFSHKDMEHVQFRTGDPVIDDWEKKLAEGRDSEINWDAGVDPDFLKRFKAFSRRTDETQSPELAEEKLREEAIKVPIEDQADFLSSLVGGFSDDYTV